MFDTKKTTDELIDWIREQVGDCNVVIGISGGKDSTICAMLLQLAIGPTRVYGIKMPNGEQKDIEDSKRVCFILNIIGTTVNIGKAYQALTNSIDLGCLSSEGGLSANDGTRTNTPARLRMAVLYDIALRLGNARVINTCNLSEDWVGYSTKFGDSAGDFSPLGKLTVPEVLAVGEECANRLGIYEQIKDLIFKTPDDGMSGKSDEDKLGFTYADESLYIRTGKCSNEETKSKIDRMHAANLHKIKPMPTFDPKLPEIAK